MRSYLLLKSMLIARELQKSRKQKKKSKSTKSSTVKKINFKTCRVCSQEMGTIPIFQNHNQPDIAKDIENFSGVMISENDKLPKHLCQKCLDLLNGCITFRDMCQKTNKRIEQLIKKKPEPSSYRAEAIALQERKKSYNIPSPAHSEGNLKFWDCTPCDQYFPDLESYITHLSEHKRRSKRPKNKKKISKDFLCDICGKVTVGSNAHLILHKTIHYNVFPYKCEQCPYRGRTLSLLKVHRRSHLADKPFKCAQCPLTASTTSNLAKHVRDVHTTNIRDFKCSYCGKEFPSKYGKQHIRRVHLRQAVECNICFKIVSKMSLRSHMLKIHKIKLVKQGRLPSYLQCQLEQIKNDNSQWQTTVQINREP